MLHRMFPSNVSGNITHARMPLFTRTMPIKSLGLPNGLIRVSLIEATSIIGMEMKMRFLLIAFAAIAIEIQCRSITFANVKDAEKESAACMKTHRSVRVHRDGKESPANWMESTISSNLTDEIAPPDTLEQLKNLITSYKENVAKFIEFAARTSKTKNSNQREIQFLNQLGSLIEQLVKEQSKMKSTYVKTDNVTNSILDDKGTIKSVSNLKDLLDTMEELDIVYQDEQISDEHIRIKRALESVYKVTSSSTTSDWKEQIGNLLTDIQRQANQIWKYLGKLCKKHHSTSTITSKLDSEDNISTIN